MAYLIESKGLAEMARYLQRFPETAREAAMLAINQVADRNALRDIRAGIEEQIAFPKGYLQQQDRLSVSKKATRNNLSAIITARDRATSLARFSDARSPAETRGKPLRIQVKRGRTSILRAAFLVQLKNGNIGLAVRLKDGETIQNKREVKAVLFEKNIYLLYGPSVDQIFQTLLPELAPGILDRVDAEFSRQFVRLSNRGRL